MCVAACLWAVAPIYAQDTAPRNPFPQSYNTYDDYREFAEVTPEASSRIDRSEDDIALDDLEALLPDHLRAPLPLREAAPQVARGSYDLADTPARPALQPESPIEAFYREATGDSRLTQYGYEFFSGDVADVQPAAGTVQDDYLLGPGDRLNIMFLGERKDRGVYKIDRNGSLSIDLLPSMAAAGKTLETLRTDLQHMMDAQGYHGEVFLSLEAIRQVSVLVAGHVVTPGRQGVSPLQTVLEALEAAGGVSKTGSLRQIRLIRGGETTMIDLYGVMGQGSAQALPTLRDGDRIIVPPLGPTMAATGDVRQPGIYELPPRKKIATSAALQLAGGVLSSGQNRITLMSPQTDGRRTAVAVDRTSDVLIGDGAVLAVIRTADRPASSFTLMGEVRSPGAYPLAQYKKLSQLLPVTADIRG